jgi:hypothetical protein
MAREDKNLNPGPEPEPEQQPRSEVQQPVPAPTRGGVQENVPIEPAAHREFITLRRGK